MHALLDDFSLFIFSYLVAVYNGASFERLRGHTQAHTSYLLKYFIAFNQHEFPLLYLSL